jgi:hypothetical protein
MWLTGTMRELRVSVCGARHHPVFFSRLELELELELELDLT